MLTGILIAVFAIGIILLTRSITTLIHELGHAIPSLIFTKEEVIICVGSYENLTKSKGIQIGRLTVFFTLNLLNWNSGLCLHQGVTSFFQKFLIILGGPLASLLIGLLMIYMIRDGWVQESLVVVPMFLLVSALWDFISNILPHSQPLVTHNGNVVYNDGYQLKQLLTQRRLPPSHQQALTAYQEQKYERVLQLLQADTLTNSRIQRIFVDALLQTGALTAAEETFYQYFGEQQLTAADWTLIAQIKMEQQEHRNAIVAFDRAIYLDFKNPLLLNQKGLCHTSLTEYEQAINSFSKSLLYQPDFYDSLANRAYALIQLEQYKTATRDLAFALKLNPTYGKTFFNLGLLEKAEGRKAPALTYFNKAKELGFQHHGLEYFIAEVS